MTRRSGILRAIREASKVLADFPPGNRTSFDIVGAVIGMNIPLVFRPLDGLLGTVVAIGDVSGIMITTKRSLHIQRFTLAHELGHILLGHQLNLDGHHLSLDREIEVTGRNAPSSRPDNEVAADTFASELLGPRHLLLASAQRHKWTKHKLHQPANIYQLSLRLGISYQAACWALVTSKVLTSAEARSLHLRSVKEQKQNLADLDLITDPWADVWELTDADADTFLETGPNDLFAIHVQDHASAGYLWQLVDTGSSTEIVGERRTSSDHAYGEHSTRIIYLRFTNPGTHRLVFEHIRPWSGATLSQIEIDIDGYGKELDGFARRQRHQALAIAA